MNGIELAILINFLLDIFIFLALFSLIEKLRYILDETSIRISENTNNICEALLHIMGEMSDKNRDEIDKIRKELKK